jgi:hypothetical protein
VPEAPKPTEIVDDGWAGVADTGDGFPGPAAINEAIVSRVDDGYLHPFGSEDEVAEFLHNRLYSFSVQYDIEIGARIYAVGDGWFFTRPRTDFLPNGVNSGSVPSGARGGVAGAWHTHPSGNPFNAADFGRATNLRDRRGRTTYISHMMQGQPVLSRVYYYSREVLTLDGGEWRDLDQFSP